MTSRRQFEIEVWMHLGGYINAGDAADLGIEDYDEMSEADQARVDKAIERVAMIVHRHSGHGR